MIENNSEHTLDSHTETQAHYEIKHSGEELETITDSNEASRNIKKNEENQHAEVNDTRNIRSGKYLYAIISGNGEANFGKIGILDEEVYVIRYEGLAGVVSDTEKGEYELTEANAKRHNEVLQLLLEANTVIPAEFETVLQSGEVLKHLLENANTHIMEALRSVENCVELGVKGVIRKDLANTQEYCKTTEILDPLKSLAIKSVSGELFSDRLLFNESFLIKKDRLPSFSEKVAQLRSMYPMVKLLYSGPWAPYNFIHIKIGKEGIEFKQ